MYKCRRSLRSVWPRASAALVEAMCSPSQFLELKMSPPLRFTFKPYYRNSKQQASINRLRTIVVSCGQCHTGLYDLSLTFCCSFPRISEAWRTMISGGRWETHLDSFVLNAVFFLICWWTDWAGVPHLLIWAFDLDYCTLVGARSLG